MLLSTLTLALVPTVPVPAQDLHQLLPEGTFAYFEVASLDAMGAAFRDVVGAIEPADADDFDANDLLTDVMELPGDISGVRHDLPIGVAVAFPGDVPQPVPVYLVPFADPTAYAASLPPMPGMAAPIVAGSYVALTMGPELGAPGGGASLTSGLRKGLVTGRVDLARLIEAYRPMIDMGMDMGRMQVEGELDSVEDEMPIDLEEMLDFYFDSAEVFLESAEALELTLEVDGTQIRFHEVFTAKEGSALGSVAGRSATPLSAVAGSVAPNAAFSMVGTADMRAMMEQMTPLLGDMISMYPEEIGASYMDLLAIYEPIYDLLGDAFSASADFGADGMRVAYTYAGGQPEKAIEGMTQVMSNPNLRQIGIEITSEPTLREVGGGPVHVHELSYDWAQLMALGAMGEDTEEISAMVATLIGETFQLSLAPRGDRLVIAMGGDDAFLTKSLANAVRTGPAPSSLAPSVAALGNANPAFAMQFDMAALLYQIGPDLARAMGEERDADKLLGLRSLSFPIGMWFGVEGGRVWRGGFALDVKQAAAFMEVMD